MSGDLKLTLWPVDPERLIPNGLPRIGERTRRRLGSPVEIANTTHRLEQKQPALTLMCQSPNK